MDKNCYQWFDFKEIRNKEIKAYNQFFNDINKIKKDSSYLEILLDNIFTMRVFGNKMHGDTAEVGLTEFVNKYMTGYTARHVGKELFRAKSKEEDVQIINDETGTSFVISLKAYGKGNIQLSTNKESNLFPLLESYDKKIIDSKDIIDEIYNNTAFSHFNDIDVLALIYDEKKLRCNILVFNNNLAIESTAYIKRMDPGDKDDKLRKHRSYRFYDINDNYIMEVRYGDARANALQRGLWSHTDWAESYFNSLTDGWMTYKVNKTLVELFPKLLTCSKSNHEKILSFMNSLSDELDIDYQQEMM